jgi:hypothetical protein
MTPNDDGIISDGFHTMPELYSHRVHLFLIVLRVCSGWAWRTRRHHPDDAPMYNGFFLAGLNPPEIGEIAYHLPLEFWGYLEGVRTLEHAEPWDGYTSDDVLDRLLAWATLIAPAQPTRGI